MGGGLGHQRTASSTVRTRKAFDFTEIPRSRARATSRSTLRSSSWPCAYEVSPLAAATGLGAADGGHTSGCTYSSTRATSVCNRNCRRYTILLPQRVNAGCTLLVERTPLQEAEEPLRRFRNHHQLRKPRRQSRNTQGKLQNRRASRLPSFPARLGQTPVAENMSCSISWGCSGAGPSPSAGSTGILECPKCRFRGRQPCCSSLEGPSVLPKANSPQLECVPEVSSWL